MLKSQSQSNNVLSQIILLSGLLLFSLPALAAQTSDNSSDWSAVVKISFTNPESGYAANCSGVLVSPGVAITSASCLLAEETAKQSRSARVCAERAIGSPCLETTEIFTHSRFLSTQSVNSAHNLAYLKLRGRFDLNKHNIRIPEELSPTEFQQLAQLTNGFPETYWVNYNRRGINSLPRNDFRGVIAPLEFNYQEQNLQYAGHELRLGSHFAGAPVFINHDGEMKLLGLLSGISPDRTVHYYPEVNPCDLDPVIVRYPKEIMRYVAEVTPYSVAACGMQGFQEDGEFTPLNCKRMERAISSAANVDKDNPVALRQLAATMAAAEDAKINIAGIYGHLNKAISMGDIKAREILAEIFLNGELIPEDRDSARDLLQDTEGELISNFAHWIQARELLRGYNDEDFRSLNSEVDQQLFTHLTVAAESGYAQAQYYLGRMHQYGLVSKPDDRKAYDWFARAAMQGHSKAQFQLGTMWVDGRGVRAYPEVGLYWIRQSAARGYTKANNYLALNKGQYKIDTALNEYEMEYNDT